MRSHLETAVKKAGSLFNFNRLSVINPKSLGHLEHKICQLLLYGRNSQHGAEFPQLLFRIF